MSQPNKQAKKKKCKCCCHKEGYICSFCKEYNCPGINLTNKQLESLIIKKLNSFPTPQPNKEWEEEFDKKLYRNDAYGGFINASATAKCSDQCEHYKIEKIKSFIRSLLAQQRQEIVEKIIKLIEKRFISKGYMAGEGEIWITEGGWKKVIKIIKNL